MKNIHITLFLVLSLSFSSFAMLNQGNKDSEKEQMQVDAYAKANIECEYSLAKLKLSQDQDNEILKRRVRELNKEVIAFRQKMFSRYSDIGDLKMEFNSLVKASSNSLTVCKKLETLEKSIAEEKAVLIEAEKSKVKSKK